MARLFYFMGYDYLSAILRKGYKLSRRKKSHRYNVTFQIETKLISLEELSKRIGTAYSLGSHNKGFVIKFGKRKTVFRSTLFCLNSELPQTAKFEKHLDSIIKKVEKSQIFKREPLPKDAYLSISVAEFWNTNNFAYFDLVIPEKYVKWCGQKNIRIEVVAYPWSD